MTLVWDILGLLQGQALWWQIGYWSLAAGLVMALPAMATGLIDFAVIGDNPAAERAALRHMTLMGSAACVALANLLLRHNDTPLHDPMIPLALSALCLTLVFAGGWFGGELVYRHGVGRTG
jgi:uncharacterized membrane protein